MKLPGPLLSLLRRLMVLSLLLRVRMWVLPSDCVDADELVRLRVFWLDIVYEAGWSIVVMVGVVACVDGECDMVWKWLYLFW
jgi:hypothetical protein